MSTGISSRERLVRVGIVVTSSVLSLLMLEVGFRVKAVYDDRELDAFERLGSVPLVTSPNTKVKTRNIIRLSRNPRIVYELVPRVHANYKRAIITINERGLRGPSVTLESTPGNVSSASETP